MRCDLALDRHVTTRARVPLPNPIAGHAVLQWLREPLRTAGYALTVLVAQLVRAEADFEDVGVDRAG